MNDTMKSFGNIGPMRPKWKVQEFGRPFESEEGEYGWELSVVRLTNKHGQQSWGWGDENKIIICGNENQLNPGTKAQVAFMRKAAKILCEGLNNS